MRRGRYIKAAADDIDEPGRIDEPFTWPQFIKEEQTGQRVLTDCDHEEHRTAGVSQFEKTLQDNERALNTVIDNLNEVSNLLRPMPGTNSDKAWDAIEKARKFVVSARAWNKEALGWL